ncbi:endo-1,4-beta-xylanase [Mucilaginibacter calamicampi]|uniref:Beta-xylanase n=1 Tax=Mucilaginibacter calamicampi TaxID=1302352 RepID=A0ABW2Z5P8_9SPHI
MSNLYRSISAAKKRHAKTTVIALALGSAIVAVQWMDPKPKAPKTRAAVEKGLKDYYKDYFKIGVAVNVRNTGGGDETELIKKEFNSITPENDMKMVSVHPSEHVWNWTNADKIADFAVKNGIKLRGHNLLWHSQVGAWMFKDSLTGQNVSKEVLLQRLKTHITTVVNRYKGKIYAWDVVNEAIDDKPEVFMRNSLWYQIAGDDFIPAAFTYAHAADPNVELYYNDYNESNPSKRDKIYKLVQSLLEKKIPITGIGLQCHWKIESPSTDDIRAAFAKYASLGVKLQVTELDITARQQRPRGETPDTAAAYSPEMSERQTKRYKEVFEIFRENKKALNSVTFWNVSDRGSWLDGRNMFAGGAAATAAPAGAPPAGGPPAGAPPAGGPPAAGNRPAGAPGAGGPPAGFGQGRPRGPVVKAYPLLFGVNLERKPAYFAVTDFKK